MAKTSVAVFTGIFLSLLISCSDSSSVPPGGSTDIASGTPSGLPSVDVQRVPDGGIHPRVLHDDWGDTHLLYFKIELPEEDVYLGNLYYSRYDHESESWRPAIKVSAEPFNYRDPVYRASLTVDGEGRVHVVWFLDRPSRYVYTRSDINKSVFETPQLIVEQHVEGIDAAADIASYNNRVALVWGAGDLMQEDERTVYMRESLDYGASFGDEIMIGDMALGACACCSLTAEFDQAGELMVAYRSAVNGTGRHMQQLIINRNAHDDVQMYYQPVHPLSEWDLSSCPVTTNDMARDGDGEFWLVYENQSRIIKLNMSGTGEAEPELVSGLSVSEASVTREKHPAIAFNPVGYHLIAWGEGGGFFSGGELRHAMFDGEGNRVTLPELEELQIPDRSFVAVMVKPDGNFSILY